MNKKQEQAKNVALKKLIKKTRLKNLEVKPLRGSVISRELAKNFIKHPLIYHEIIKDYQYFILSQSNLKFVLAFAENFNFINLMDVYKLRKKVVERGSIQQIINLMQALPTMEMKQETSILYHKIEKYTDLFGKNLQEWNEAGFTNPHETIKSTKYPSKIRTKKQEEELFVLERFDDLYFKHCSQTEIDKKRNEFLSDACYKIATSISNANVAMLEDKILQCGIEKDIIKFMKDVKGASSDLIERFYESKRAPKCDRSTIDYVRNKDFEEKLENAL